MKTIVMILVSAGALIAAGCQKNSTLPVQAVADANYTLSPADGASGVPTNTILTIVFPITVDRDIVEQNIHVISERGMTDSLCPVSPLMNHSKMAIAMTDTATMRHLNAVHSIKGRFTWNSNGTICSFIPDSVLQTDTRYMVHVGAAMTKMLSQQVGRDGSINGNGFVNSRLMEGAETMSDDMTTHFVTIGQTSGTGSGHNGHH